MKAIQKTAALIVTAAMAVSAAAVSSFAADDTYKLYVKAEDASVVDIVPVSVALDAIGEQGVGGISFKLHFNPEELEVQADSVKAGDTLNGWMGDINTSKAEEGIIGFAYTTISKGVTGENAALLNLSFKVLKVNGTLTLEEVDIAADDDDGTNLTDKVVVLQSTVKCSHKNTETKTTPSTCKDKGKEETVCKDCGETVSTKELPLAEHTWDKGAETKPASCTEKGETTYKCTVCGETKTEEIPALGHDYVEVKEESKVPTCTESGKKVSKCSRCGDVKEEEIPAKGHTYGDWETVKEPTEDEEGSEKRVCSVCGEEETRAIPVKEAPITTAAEASVTTTTETPVTTSAEASGTSAAENNTQGGNKDNNINTGIAFCLIPAAIAAAGVVIAKKRK